MLIAFTKSSQVNRQKNTPSISERGGSLAVDVGALGYEPESTLDDSRRGNLANLVLGDIVPGVVGIAEVVLNAVAGFLDAHAGEDGLLVLVGVVRPVLGLVVVGECVEIVGDNSDEHFKSFLLVFPLRASLSVSLTRKVHKRDSRTF